MHLHHDAKCLGRRPVEHGLEDFDHEVHRGVVVVDQQDLEARGLFGLLLRAFKDEIACLLSCVGHRRAEPAHGHVPVRVRGLLISPTSIRTLRRPRGDRPVGREGRERNARMSKASGVDTAPHRRVNSTFPHSAFPH